MVMTVTLSEQEDRMIRTIAHVSGKDQTEILHEAIRRYITTFQQEQVAHDEYASLSDDDLTLIAESSFLALDAAEVADGYA